MFNRICILYSEPLLYVSNSREHLQFDRTMTYTEPHADLDLTWGDRTALHFQQLKEEQANPLHVC